jgi:GWxTD domain-containing protein
MRRLLAAVSLLALLSSASAAANLPSLFYKAKEQFRLANYQGSLQTLDELQQESERPGNESYRAQLAPGLAFYRGASLAALGRAEEARASFEIYLTYQPNTTLDPSMYPPRVIAALQDARKEIKKAPSLQAPETQAAAERGSFAAAYRAFRFESTESDGADEAWSKGPARYLLTSEQVANYDRLSTLAERSEFVTEFWKAHDPTPETPENEFRYEFERRVAFADARLSQEETRGSLTDRGMLFVLLGPPTWVGRKPLAVGEDTADPEGMSRYTSHDITQALNGATSVGDAAAVISTMMGPGNTLPDNESSWREVWHYRRELLPSAISYHQVDFEFVTKRGYGRNVLQRDEIALTTLEAAKSASRSGVFARQAAK